MMQAIKMGNPRVVEGHNTVRSTYTLKCVTCGTRWDTDRELDTAICKCGGTMRHISASVRNRDVG